jgi:hypothetical protein
LTGESLRVTAALPADFVTLATERGIVSRAEDILTLEECS